MNHYIKQKIEKYFDEYLKAVYNNREVPINQFIELKRAFYCGINMLFDQVTQVASQMEEDDAVEYFDQVKDELVRFSKLPF